MNLTEEQIKKIENTIKQSLRNKFRRYKPESKNMPFHYRLLGRDRMALFSFIHSLNTTFGTSIFEPVAETLAKLNFPRAKRQFIAGDTISEAEQIEIQRIMNDLTIGKNPDKNDEITRIRKVCRQGKINRIKTVKVDLFVEDENGVSYLFDIKTAKPNISNFKDFKRTLLEWVAIYLSKYPDKEVHTYIAIPYNPYEPKPYERWTLKGMLDLDNELKVADEFWDFIGGKGAYELILKCFEKVGRELRPEIDAYFAKFR
ncbi:type II restriction endonuclease, TdeIII [Thermodesulfovibrio aggregans]|uniref:type II site-specific deoxyribonuclease n=1 Tax=Thermodesulfovibrio aggregans TaxID=86166 RepID=A0A0U9HRQ8_9BACT|nr:TdeIII family type II restriction endonuclease [Thermodesulfovibrio aggregans]GAQ95728.1 type II restriction endonuclease, TdeIII [Thermodesulfovibrio aggregans]